MKDFVFVHSRIITFTVTYNEIQILKGFVYENYNCEVVAADTITESRLIVIIVLHCDNTLLPRKSRSGSTK